MFSRRRRGDKFAKSIDEDFGHNKFNDLTGTYNKIKNSFEPQQKIPVDRILSNASLRANEYSHKTTGFNSARIFKTASVGAIIIFAAFATLVYLETQSLSPEIKILRKALAAIEPQDKIIYYKQIYFLGLAPSDNNDLEELIATQKRETEIWVYPKKRMLKKYQSSAFSEEAVGQIESMTLIKDGKKMDVDKSNDSGSVYETPADLAEEDFVYYDELSYLKLMYKKAIETGTAKLAGEEQIDGIDTYKIRVLRRKNYTDIRKFDSLASWEEIKKTKAEFTDGQEVYIRKDNYRPLKIVTAVFDVKTFKPILDDRFQWHPCTTLFTEIKEINPDDVDPGVFSVELPKEGTFGLTKKYSSVNELKQFQDFDLYYLGDRWEGLNLNMNMTEQYKSAGYPKGEIRLSEDETTYIYQGPTNQLTFEYYKGKKGFIYITIRPADDPLAKNPKWGFLKNTEFDEITIDRAAAKLVRMKPKGGNYRYGVIIKLGNSSVHISSTGKDLVIKAAKNLKKLN